MSLTKLQSKLLPDKIPIPTKLHMNTVINFFSTLIHECITDFTGNYCTACNALTTQQVFCAACNVSIKLINIKNEQNNNFSFFLYQGALQRTIIQAKFAPNQAVAASILTLLDRHTQLLAILKKYNFDAITFVPIHYRRRLKRGFDFSSLFAKKLAIILKLPVWDILICSQFIKPSTLHNREIRCFAN